jgi:hypothetical protein
VGYVKLFVNIQQAYIHRLEAKIEKAEAGDKKSKMMVTSAFFLSLLLLPSFFLFLCYLFVVLTELSVFIFPLPIFQLFFFVEFSFPLFYPVPSIYCLYVFCR